MKGFHKCIYILKVTTNQSAEIVKKWKFLRAGSRRRRYCIKIIEKNKVAGQVFVNLTEEKLHITFSADQPEP